MRNTILFVLLLCLPNIVLSQTDFRKGFIITPAHDTIAGYVDFKENSKALEICLFRTSIDSITRSYGPKELMGYGFENGKYFESIDYKNADGYERVFVEVIVRGTVSLYRSKEFFLVRKEGQEFIALTNESQEMYVEGKRVIINSNKFISTLNFLLVGCPEIRSSINRVSLTRKALTQIIGDYNKCKGADVIIFDAKKKWLIVSVGLSGGINISDLNFYSVVYGYQYLTSSFGVSRSAVGGISMDFLLPRMSERISFNTNVFFTSSKYYRYSMFTDVASVRNYLSIELTQLKIPVGVTYTFPEKKITPILRAGVSSTVHLKSNSEWIQEREFNHIVVTSNTPLQTKSNQFGFWAGVGAQRSISKKLSLLIEARYERTSGITPTSDSSDDFPSSISNFQFLVGIKTK